MDGEDTHSIARYSVPSFCENDVTQIAARYDALQRAECRKVAEQAGRLQAHVQGGIRTRGTKPQAQPDSDGAATEEGPLMPDSLGSRVHALVFKT